MCENYGTLLCIGFISFWWWWSLTHFCFSLILLWMWKWNGTMEGGEKDWPGVWRRERGIDGSRLSGSSWWWPPCSRVCPLSHSLSLLWLSSKSRTWCLVLSCFLDETCIILHLTRFTHNYLSHCVLTCVLSRKLSHLFCLIASSPWVVGLSRLPEDKHHGIRCWGRAPIIVGDPISLFFALILVFPVTMNLSKINSLFCNTSGNFSSSRIRLMIFK